MKDDLLTEDDLIALVSELKQDYNPTWIMPRSAAEGLDIEGTGELEVVEGHILESTNNPQVFICVGPIEDE